MDETIVKMIAEEMNLSLEGARKHIEAQNQKKWLKREQIYNFLKSRNPDVVRLEQERRQRIQDLMEESGLPEHTAAAVIVVGDIQCAHAIGKLKEQENVSTWDLQAMLGFKDIIPHDILDLLEEEGAT